jgi:glycosyltransferase involved in cell wall biosynthesis
MQRSTLNSERARSAAVSIVICAYNASRYIRRAVQSALDQTHQNLQVIVVDDASADSTAAIAAEFARADKRVSLVRRAENGGLAAARMSGLAQVTSEFVVFLDADDVALPRMLERQLTPLLQDPFVMGVATYAYYIGEQELPRLGIQQIGPVTREEYLRSYEREKLIFLPATTLARTEMVLAAGGFRTDGFPKQEGVRYQDYCDDLDLWCRLSDRSAAGYYFLTIPEPLFLYRKTGNSLSGQNVSAMQSKMRWIKDCLRRRRRGIEERSFETFLQSVSPMQRLLNLKSDYAALYYKKVALCFVNARYLRAALYAAVVIILEPRLVLQKLRTQKRA